MRGVALLSLALAGCTSAGTTAPPTEQAAAPAAVVVAETAEPEAPPPARAVQASLEVVTVQCERAVRCGTIGRSQLEECRKGPGRSRLTLVWGFPDLLRFGELVAQGRLAIDAAGSRACLEFLASAPCRYEQASAPAGCFAGGVTAYAPKVPPGGACERWDECADGFCTAQPGCSGVCVAKAPIGGACGSDQLCVDGAFCWEGTCRARAGVGEVCGGHWQWCKDGLLCDGFDPGDDDDHGYRRPRSGVCSAGKQLGEDCVPPVTSSHEICAVPLFCDWGDPSPVCRAPLAEGAECRWLDACADGLACAGLTLGGRHPRGYRYGVRAPGRCVRVLDAGDACDPSAFVSGCPASMICDLAAKVCRSRGHVGDPCTSSWVTKPTPDDEPLRTEGCFGAHYCDMKTRTCQRQLARGARCVPQPFGVEDEPCFLGRCDAKTRRCAARCGTK